MPSRYKRSDDFDKAAPQPILSATEIVVMVVIIGMTIIAAVMVGLGLHSALQNLSELT